MTDHTPTEDETADRPTRRGFVAGALGTVAVGLGYGTYVSGNGDVGMDPWLGGALDSVDDEASIPDGANHWLGPQFWGNRLQDWRRRDGRIECLRGEAGYELRTVGVLTRELVRAEGPAHIRVTTGVVDGADAGGFCGFLLGVGDGDLDYRARALCQRASGEGGGFLCTLGTDGAVGFREHTSEERPLRYDPLPSETLLEPEDGDRIAADDAVDLELDAFPRDDGRFDVGMRARDAGTGEPFAAAVRRDVPEVELIGGISLVSSPPPGAAGARWWFRDLETAGPKAQRYPERTFGPIAGTLFSLDDGTLKLSAQLFPLGDDAPDDVALDRRPAESDGDWAVVDRATIGPGHTALFRRDDWNDARAWEYRVRYVDGDGERWTYEGRIPADPGADGERSIGLVSCSIATARRLDGGTTRRHVPQARRIGRYTAENCYFPYETLTANLAAQDPDLLAFVGDQLYEHSPTGPDGTADPDLDYLYKWLLWVWSFRDLTRDRPTVVLVDDHDLYQKNVWGAGGRDSLFGAETAGGYVRSADFVDRVQRIQCGHNPAPYDPEPVDRDIGVYYGAFEYAGMSVAMLEDRKFKSPPPTMPPGLRPDWLPGDPGDRLLGERQLSFLQDWADRNDRPLLCLTQTVFASVQTDADGRPVRDYDANGYPSAGRDRAVERLSDAGALVLAGDQHLATLVRHGLDDHDDGVLQFAGPAAGALFQRWFEPGDLPHGRAGPYTGRFTDAFGNDLRVLAVANPEISLAQYERHEDAGRNLFDRALKCEGYGLVRVDHDAEEFVIECWPRDADPAGGADAQFDGWPYRVGFDEAGGGD